MTRAKVFADALLMCAACVSCVGEQGGSIEGDAFLVMQSGDVRPLAGQQVGLIPDPEQALQVVAKQCEAYESGFIGLLSRLPVPPSAWQFIDGYQLHPVSARAVEEIARDKTDLERWAGVDWGSGPKTRALREAYDSLLALMITTETAIRSTLTGLAATSAQTGIQGHYQVSGLPAGRYAVWMETLIGDNAYTLWLDTVVVKGDTSRADLSNAAEQGQALYCGRTSPATIQRAQAFFQGARDSIMRIRAERQANQAAAAAAEAERRRVQREREQAIAQEINAAWTACRAAVSDTARSRGGMNGQYAVNAGMKCDQARLDRFGRARVRLQ